MRPEDLSAAVAGFEAQASDLVSGEGGRVVKLIGDEVMFAATDLAGGCRIAVRLMEVFRDHPVLSPLRAAVAAGEALLFEGDYFGPVVNLAARLVSVAAPGQVLVPSETTHVLADGWGLKALGPRDLKGFPEPVAVTAVESQPG